MTTEKGMSFKTLLNTQRDTFGLIDRTISNFNKIRKENVTAAKIQSRIDILEERWELACKYHNMIDAVATDDERKTEEYFIEKEYSNASDQYEEAMDLLSDWKAKFAPVTPAGNSTLLENSFRQQQQGNSVNIKLPQINLPKFSGNYLEWISFHDLFKSLVHDSNRLSDVQKLHYLMSSLDGEALQMLSSLTITEANYKKAWDALKSRYEDKHLIINKVLDDLFSISPASQESSCELKRIYNKCKIAIDSLDNLGEAKVQRDWLFIHHIVNRFDKQTRKAWELSLCDINEYPELSIFEAFLKKRINALEAIQPQKQDNSNQRQNKNIKSHHTTTDKSNANLTVELSSVNLTNICVLCKSQHVVAKCPQFQTKTVDQRYEILKTNNLCFNCTRSGHRPYKCSSKYRCNKCNKLHHSLLHRNVDPHHNNNSDNSNLKSENIPETKNISHLSYEGTRRRRTAMFGTARVLLKGPNGRSQIVRAMIDPCSDQSFITESMVQKLGLPRRRIHATVEGLAGAHLTTATAIVTLNIESLINPSIELTLDTFVCQDVTRYAPPNKQDIDIDSWPHLQGLTYADAEPFSNFHKVIQNDVLAKELNMLRKDGIYSKSSVIKQLNPFVDPFGLIRVGGRLEHSPLSYAEKHPIILMDHTLSTLIVRHAHLRTLHGGVQLTARVLRQTIWMVRARYLINRCIKGCIECTRHRAYTASQIMGSLPSARVTPSVPFTHTGIDYAGPINYKLTKIRNAKIDKAYICIFICLDTRAIHIQLVSDYTTEGFIAALRRFGSRRGYPKIIYSDNAKNFVGASRQLQKVFRQVLSDPQLHGEFAVEGLRWKFIPPASPHFGGLWEAGVKSVKHHLKRVIRYHKLTFEEFTTLTCQIEACVNSRPVASINHDTDEFASLTPGHFLTGGKPLTLPETSILDLNELHLKCWNLIQQRLEQFWRLWRSDYLNTLQQRSKWRCETPNLLPGTLVLLKNTDLPPDKWDLGLIEKCHPGKDGKVRIVTVKTAKTTFKRGITEICPLSVKTEDS